MDNINLYNEVIHGHEKDSEAASAAVCGAVRYFTIDRQAARQYCQPNSKKRNTVGNQRTRKTSKVNKWDKVRAELKKEFERLGVTCCEMCGGNFALSFAHSLKRRFITTDEQLREVALLCQACHTRVEHSGHENMYDAITRVILNRKLRTELSDHLRNDLITKNAVAVCEICDFHSFSLDNMTADGRICRVCLEATYDK
jgi:hypothetical protein